MLRHIWRINKKSMDSEDELILDEEDQDEFFANIENPTGQDYLLFILQHMVESGRVPIFDSMEERFSPKKLPTINGKVNLDALQKSSFYQNVKKASGFNADSTSPEEKWSVLNMLHKRQMGREMSSFTQSERCKLHNLYLPNHSERSLIKLDAKIFCGTFSKDGNYFITASQDHVLRIYDASTPDYKLINQIAAKDVTWCILDIDFSPNREYFVYSTWSDCLHLSKIHGTSEEVQCLSLNPNVSRFSVFSVAYSNCGKKVIGSSNDGSLYIYDMILGRRILKINQGDDEINAVRFVDETSNILCSGANNGAIKVWDLRTLGENHVTEVGNLNGHYDGVTYIDSKNDGRYLISNSKDQTIKLWDMRVFSPKTESRILKVSDKHIWDYRWDPVPQFFYNANNRMEGDVSVMTYRGHKVTKSLIRSKFSPVATTGQRYIYTGCGTGHLIIYDVLTGKIVRSIDGHSEIVRDVAWHPKRSEILTSSWDAKVNLNIYRDNIEKVTNKPPLRRSMRIACRNNQST